MIYRFCTEVQGIIFNIRLQTLKILAIALGSFYPLYFEIPFYDKKSFLNIELKKMNDLFKNVKDFFKSQMKLIHKIE